MSIAEPTSRLRGDNGTSVGLGVPAAAWLFAGIEHLGHGRLILALVLSRRKQRSRINPIRATSARRRYPHPCRVPDNPRVAYRIARHWQHIGGQQLSL
jgi:hypothetical protein